MRLSDVQRAQRSIADTRTTRARWKWFAPGKRQWRSERDNPASCFRVRGVARHNVLDHLLIHSSLSSADVVVKFWIALSRIGIVIGITPADETRLEKISDHIVSSIGYQYHVKSDQITSCADSQTRHSRYLLQPAIEETPAVEQCTTIESIFSTGCLDRDVFMSLHMMSCSSRLFLSLWVHSFEASEEYHAQTLFSNVCQSKLTYNRYASERRTWLSLVFASSMVARRRLCNPPGLCEPNP